MFQKDTYKAIEWRLNFGNRSNSLGDHKGGRYVPPPQQNMRLAGAQRGAG